MVRVYDMSTGEAIHSEGWHTPTARSMDNGTVELRLVETATYDDKPGVTMPPELAHISVRDFLAAMRFETPSGLADGA